MSATDRPVSEQVGARVVDAGPAASHDHTDDYDEEWLHVLDRVSVRVTMVVAGVALAAWLALAADLPVAGSVAVAATCLVLPVLAYVDARTKILPNAFIHPAFIVAVTGSFGAAAASGDLTSWAFALAVAAAAYAFYFTVWFLAPAGGFGYGDVRLAGLLGFALGFGPVTAAAVGIVVVPLVVGLVLAALIGRNASIPFGPAMVAGAVCALAFPDVLDNVFAHVVTP